MYRIGQSDVLAACDGEIGDLTKSVSKLASSEDDRKLMAKFNGICKKLENQTDQTTESLCHISNKKRNTEECTKFTKIINA